MQRANRGTRVGVFIDVENINRNGGFGMRYDVLREFACRDGAEALRLNAYVAFDAERATADPAYREGTLRFHGSLRDMGYKVIVKPVKWYADAEGNRFGKANADMDLAVDALLQSENLDRVLLATGDGDFVRVVQTLQSRGCRVEVTAFESVSRDLRQEADFFFPAYCVPHLLPIPPRNGEKPIPWGEPGSRVRGWCYFHKEDEGYGFMRYLRMVSPHLLVTETRDPDSPYGTAFLHDTRLPPEVNPKGLPSRTLIFEWTLAETDKGVQAEDVRLVTRL
jgi:uncharacterized LabA/DUF88 family protein